NAKIIGGRAAVRRQAPFVASIRNFGTTFHVASGALISNRWVVTCASVLVGRAGNSFDVALGIIEITTSPTGSVSRRSSSITPHPDFNALTRDNDIGLIHLDGTANVAYNDFILPIFFDGIRNDNVVTAVLFGWGSITNEVGPTSNTLWFLHLTTISNEACEAVHNNRINNDKICTNNSNGNGICTTSIGSPLVSGLQLIGIASWTAGCGTTTPNVYTRISSYRAWIGTITGI
ncbi:putative Serine protease 28, partial [Polypedilum vanderplanki]